MKDFKNKVAVVTGAASGIGKALAEHCVKEGMRVVLSDIQEDALYDTSNEMKAEGATVLPVVTDVSRAEDVEALAKKTLDAFNGVHLLFNNAGVCGSARFPWEFSIKDWEWELGVDLWSVIHGVRTFVPIMMEQDMECHIVNTASMAGLVTGPLHTPYTVAKHGVVALSESLFYAFKQKNNKMGVSVLCPHFIQSKVYDSERNRRSDLKDEIPKAQDPEQLASEEEVKKGVDAGMPAAQAAQIVFQAIRENKFYILTHPEIREVIKIRMEDILQERNPSRG